MRPQHATERGASEHRLLAARPVPAEALHVLVKDAGWACSWRCTSRREACRGQSVRRFLFWLAAGPARSLPLARRRGGKARRWRVTGAPDIRPCLRRRDLLNDLLHGHDGAQLLGPPLL